MVGLTRICGGFSFGATQLKTKVDECARVEWANEFRELANQLDRLGKWNLKAENGRHQVLSYGAEAGELLVETAELWEGTPLSSLKDETVPEVQGVELSKHQKHAVLRSHFYALWIKYCRRLSNDGWSIGDVGEPRTKIVEAESGGTNEHGTWTNEFGTFERVEIYMDEEYVLWPCQARQFALACSKISEYLGLLSKPAKKTAKPAKKHATGQFEWCRMCCLSLIESTQTRGSKKKFFAESQLSTAPVG